MGITPQIAKDPFGPTEGPLGVDNPVVAVQLLEQLLKRAWIAQRPDAARQRELPSSIRSLQTGQEPAAKQLAKDPHGQQALSSRPTQARESSATNRAG